MKSSESNVKPLKNVMALRRWEKNLEENGPEKLREYFRLGLDTGMLPLSCSIYSGQTCNRKIRASS